MDNCVSFYMHDDGKGLKEIYRKCQACIKKIPTLLVNMLYTLLYTFSLSEQMRNPAATLIPHAFFSDC